MRRCILFATLPEAEATLERLSAQRIAPSRYSFFGGEILISGLGMHRAQAALLMHGAAYDELWNLGIAGALSELPLFTLVSIGQVHKYVPPCRLSAHARALMESALPPFTLDGDERLLSSDFPLHTRKKKSGLYSLVDMEGYGVAFAAHQLSKKCSIWKIVSDFASPGGSALIAKHMRECSLALAKKVEEELCAIPQCFLQEDWQKHELLILRK